MSALGCLERKNKNTLLAVPMCGSVLAGEGFA
jgi:hypothetical protein